MDCMWHARERRSQNDSKVFWPEKLEGKVTIYWYEEDWNDSTVGGMRQGPALGIYFKTL